MSPRYRVEIVHPVSGKPQVWDVYPTRERTVDIAAMLRKHGFYAQIRRHEVDDDPPKQPEQPEHGNDRRRFIAWDVMCGFANPERLTERIVAEVDRDALT